MNKKKLMALPVACVVVAMLGASVMAAGSAEKAFRVEDEDGNDITIEYEGTPISISGNEQLSDLDGIQDEIDAYNKEAKAEDAEIVAAYYIDPVNKDHDGKKTVTFLGLDANEGDVFVVVHFDSVAGVTDISVTDAPVIEVDNVSPFYIFKISVQSSAQTGEYAAPYIVMVSVALLACGAVFAVRAKKATK